MVTVNVSLEGTTHQADESRFDYFQEALARVRRLPGVHSVSATEFLPLYSTGFVGGPLGMDGRPARESSMLVPVFPDYFRTMGGKILKGREFTETEARNNARVAIVSDRFASEFGSALDALDHQVTIRDSPPWRIIAVVKGLDYMTDGANVNQIYVPAHAPGRFSSTFVARVDGRAEDRLDMIRDTIRSVDPQVPLFGVKTMEQRMADALAQPQFYRTAVFCFAVFALLLAVVGIYGMVCYKAAQRAHEMGVRIALGTTPARLRVTLLWGGLNPIAAGAIPGIGCALLSGRLLENLVEGAKPLNAVNYGAFVLCITVIAALGIWIATRPIARLDVMAILRIE
jgi:hypothetical protein